MKTNTTRDLSLDAICGFFIIIMMLWHTRLITEEMYHLEHFFYFFMPWFYFKAGMFAKYGQGFDKDSINKSFKRLLIPCFIFAIYGLFVQMFINYVSGVDTIGGTIYTHVKEVVLFGTAISNKPVWFLISLFSVRLLFSFSSKYDIVLFSVVCALVLAKFHQHFTFNHFCFLGNIPLGYLYYVAGYYLKEKQYNKWLLIASIAIIFLEYVFIPTNVDARGNYIYYGNYLIGVVCSVFGIIIMNNLFRQKWLQLKPLLFIGTNSISFLVIHYPIMWFTQMLCVKYIGNNYSVNALITTIVIFICSFVFAYYISKSKYRWIVGG